MIRRGQGHNETTVGAMINPVNGHRGMLKKKGIVPRDHMKENRAALKESQIKNYEAQIDKRRQQEPHDLYKMSQFQNVPSRVFEGSTKEPYKHLDGGFLRRGKDQARQEELMMEAKMTRAQMEMKLREESTASNIEPPSPRKPALHNELTKCASKRDVNFIKQNRVESVMNFGHQAKSQGNNNVNNKTASLARHEEFGRVPTYLEDRKQQWAEEAEWKRANAPDPNCPKGMVCMPENERVETLSVLQASLKEALNQLQAMPFVVETVSLRRRKDALESKIKEIESAIGLFSRQKVYVAMN